MMSALPLPEFYCPFTTHMNPSHDNSWAESRRWLVEMGLVQGEQAIERLDRSGFSQLTAKAYPYAAQDDLKVAINWLVWLFLFDDQLDECCLGHQKDQADLILDRLLRLALPDAEGKLSPQSPVERAFVSLWQEYARRLSKEQQRRFSQNIRNYLSSLRWEVTARNKSALPGLLTFVEIRRDTGAVRVVLDIIEFCLNDEIPAIIADSLELQLLKNCTIDVICMSNDLFSFEKERSRGDVNNLVLVLEQNAGCSRAEAVTRIYGLVLDRQNLFMETRHRLETLLEETPLTQTQRESIRRYVEGMAHWMRANLDFSLSTPRYAEIEDSRAGKPLSWLENISAMQHELFQAPLRKD
ncbi:MULTISPECIES: terpene synthase family protein [unclassified Cedecea]|uniref:terpene synthase family protein n=2 Tax=unclassified Cedecea TaxID=2649846 RepID=UPI00301B541D